MGVAEFQARGLRPPARVEKWNFATQHFSFYSACCHVRGSRQMWAQVLA